jgi:competence protein ComGC
MVSIEHSLKFVTEFDETHPVAQQALSLPEADLVVMLEGMLKDLLIPALLPEINKINENGSYAILKVVK